MLEFNAETHEYKNDGVKIPSVTQIISACGLSDFSAVPEPVLQYSIALGNAVHRAAELVELGTLDDSTVEESVLKRLKQWEKALVVLRASGYASPVIEKPMVSRLGFCGTPDRFYVDGKKLTIVDIKTGVETKAAPIQTAAYAILTRENIDTKPRKTVRICVYLKDDSYNIVEHKNELDETIFKSCLNLHNYKNK